MNPIKKIYKKHWNNEKETSYCKFAEDILTQDGILLNLKLFDSISYQNYMNIVSNTKDKYDFNESVKSNSLSSIESSNNINKKHRGRPKGSKNKHHDNEVIKDNIFSKIRDKLKKTDNIFVPISKIIMLIVSIGTCILSIYYTSVYMSNISGNKIIGFLISITMYFFGCIGTQYASILKEQKKHIISFVICVTSIITILFSMGTSLFVNGEKYFDKSVLKEQNVKNTNNKTDFTFNLLNDELNNNNKLIEQYNKDIEFQQTQNTKDYVWVVDDNHPKGYNKETGTTSLTTKAQNAISKDKEEISKLNNRNIEIRNTLSKLVNNGALENDKVISFENLIAKYFGFDGAWIRLFLLLFSSIFIDIIGPLSLFIVRTKEV